jgi:hypothetical protein
MGSLVTKPSCPVRDVTPPNMKIDLSERVASNPIFVLKNRILLKMEVLANVANPVTPAKAGVQNVLKRLDSGFRRNDAAGLLQEAQWIEIIFKQALNPDSMRNFGPIGDGQFWLRLVRGFN